MGDKAQIILKKAVIDGNMYAVISRDKLENSSYNELIGSAVEVDTPDGQKLALPIRPLSDKGVGVRTAGAVTFTTLPSAETAHMYTNKVIDMSCIETTKELLDKQSQIKDAERDILCAPGDIFKPTIYDTDHPEMKLLKEAVSEKGININNYSHRFGENAPNDIRLYKKSTASLQMILRHADAFDMEVSMTIRDKNSDVANPIGKEITMILNNNVEEGDA